MMKENCVIARREFFGTVGGVAMAAIVPRLFAGPGLRSALFPPSLSLAMLTKSVFDQCVGELFRLQLHSAETLELELIESTALSAGGPTRPSAMREPFSLIFRAPIGTQLAQRIYKLKHSRLGTLELFLVPIGPDRQGLCLEAVFN